VGTNTAKDLSASATYLHTQYAAENSYANYLNLSITWLPVKRFKISGMALLNPQYYHQQYVTTLHENQRTDYVVGHIERTTASFTFRGELFFSPELSLQYYASPYYSVGAYEDFRRVNQSRAREIEERLEYLDLAYDPAMDQYSYERNSETFAFDNPDFSFIQFRSNLVFRWEYKLGSTIYLVWSHDRSGWESAYNPISEIAGDLFGLKGNHVFMLKVNFWFSI
jgi:hypothetical protein